MSPPDLPSDISLAVTVSSEYNNPTSWVVTIGGLNMSVNLPAGRSHTFDAIVVSPGQSISITANRLDNQGNTISTGSTTYIVTDVSSINVVYSSSGMQVVEQ